MTGTGLSRDELALVVADDIPDGSYVNLGIGLPTRVAQYAGPKRGIVFHTENGLLGVGEIADGADINPDLINAGKIPVTAVAGASYFDHAQSFALIRGGHLDYCLLGAYQVSQAGDVANWKIPGSPAAPAVGGAMDLVVGAKNIFVMMRLFDSHGACKLVEKCSYPVTGLACVNRIYTDRAVFTVTPNGLEVERAFGCTFEQLEDLTGLHLRRAPSFNVMTHEEINYERR